MLRLVCLHAFIEFSGQVHRVLGSACDSLVLWSTVSGNLRSFLEKLSHAVLIPSVERDTTRNPIPDLRPSPVSRRVKGGRLANRVFQRGEDFLGVKEQKSREGSIHLIVSRRNFL